MTYCGKGFNDGDDTSVFNKIDGSFRDDIYELACKVTEIVHGKDYDWVNDDAVAKTMSDAYSAIENVVKKKQL